MLPAAAVSCKMPFTSVTATASAKRMRDGVIKAAKVVASSTQVAFAAIQRRSSAPGGRVKLPLPGVTITSKPDSRFSYDHGSAYLHTQRRYGLAYDEAKAAAVAKAADKDLGHGYIDESLLVEQLQTMAGGPCPHCCKRATITYVGSSVCGVGGGSLDFTCDSCGGVRPVERPRKAELQGPGRRAWSWTRGKKRIKVQI